jgi:type II secretory pathway component GspD/PulD (secretin)
VVSSLVGLAQTNPPAAEVPAATAAGAALNTPAEHGTLIPLIVMDDVPLTEAVRNLARQAGLNYMLDPKIAYGQPGPEGKLAAQPSVSIRWENITAEQALNALLNNYDLQKVEDPKTRIARVTLKDPAALPTLVTRIVQLHYASPTNMLANMQAAFADKRSKVLPDIRTSQLVVVATEPEMEEVQRLIKLLDTPTKQVLIEARLLETLINPTTTKGVDWTGTLQAQNVYFGNGVMSGTSTTTSGSGSNFTSTILSSLLGKGGMGLSTAGGFTPATGFLNADGVHAVLSFLNTYAETRVLSSPRTVTLDNETAIIEVGTLFPIVNTTASTVQVAGGSQISYSNLTVRLEVTPRISANNYVQLKVAPKVMRLGAAVESKVGGEDNKVWQFNTRQLNTTVMIPSGNTLVMGGLMEDNLQEGNTKVPLLGDIPGLGLLFRSDTKSRQKSNLIVFLTPTIVEDQDFQPTKSGYLKTPVPTQDSLEADWSAWDSGKPKEWSKASKEPSQKPRFDESAVAPVTSTNAVAPIER